MISNDPANISDAQAEVLLKQNSLLLELSRAHPQDLSVAFSSFTEKIGETLLIERTSIWVYQPLEHSLKCEDLYKLSPREHIGGKTLYADLYPRYFSALEQSRFIDAMDAKSDERTSEFTEGYLIPEDIQSMLDVPIRFEGRLAGVLCCESVGTTRDWTNDEKEFATSAAEILCSLIQTDKRRKAEQALNQSEIKYRKIVDNSVVGIYHSNLVGQIVFVNQAMINIFEFSSIEEALQSSIENLYRSVSDREIFLTALSRDKVLRNYEMALISKLGNLRIVLINAFLEQDMILGMVMDITDRKHDEEDVKSARLKAEESDRLKTSLMANMSHEFRTPMNAILGFSDLISTESNDPDIVFFARKIHTSGKRLMATLKAILDLADLEATKSKIKISDIDAEDLISGIIQPFFAAANDKGLYLITEFNQGSFVRADENLLLIILQNIIDNAVKFTNQGGVTIETDLITVNGIKWSLLRVKDTGIGIPDEKFEFIFHEFRQLSEGHNRSYEGKGLGLTLARKMIELIDGKITVESELGLGSIFTVWLPASLKVDITRSIAKQSPKEELPVRTFKLQPPEELPLILVVEDNDDNAEIVKLYLKGQFKTERAPNATSALKMVKEMQFSGILMDINLGAGLDGLKATQDIRKLTQYMHIPIIAITGYTMSGDREKLLQGGCSHYLGKPFSQQALRDLMTEIFE